MDMMWGMGGMAGMMVLMAVGWLVVLAALVVGVLWLVRRLGPRRNDGALAVLRERYARGEITREEFEARRKDLAA
jgi:putative membrane protein